jgi:hypothetical protein
MKDLDTLQRTHAAMIEHLLSQKLFLGRASER